MSKKHFHGRRHIRAQATVRIGRQKRFVHKVERIKNFVRLDFPQIYKDLIEAMNILKNAMLENVGLDRGKSNELQ